MKSWPLIAYVAILSFPGLDSRAGESEIPNRFFSASGAGPIWISAEEAVRPDGSIREGVDELDRLEWNRRREMRGAQRKNPSAEGNPDCDVEFVGYVMQGGEPAVETLEALREVAAERKIVTGIVRASKVGLHHGMPHTVLSISSDSGVIQLLYPHGQMRVANMTVCNADPLYAQPPAVGDAITVVLGVPVDASGTLYWPAGSSVMYEHEGTLIVAPFLRDPALHRFDSLSKLTAALRASHEPESRRPEEP